MKAINFAILVVFLSVIFSCEERPCRRDMVNPTLGIALYKYDSVEFTATPVKAIINDIKLYKYTFVDTSSTFITNFRLPILPDSAILNIEIDYNNVMIITWDSVPFPYTIWNIDTVPEYDTIPLTDSTYQIDTVDIIDTIGFIIDTMIIYASDTNFLNNFSQIFKVYYTTDLQIFSPECGFTYEYTLDSISHLTFGNDYTDSISIIKNNIKLPDKIDENEPFHIHIYF